MNIRFFAFLFLAIPHLAFAQTEDCFCENTCSSILVLGFNEYSIYTQEQLNATFAVMYTKTEAELDEISKNSSSNDGIDATYKAVSAIWTKNRHNTEWLNRFKINQQRYEESGFIDTDFVQSTASKTVNNLTVEKWSECMEAYYACADGCNERITKPEGFYTKIIGDSEKHFTLTVYFAPQNVNERQTSIAAVSISPNVVYREPRNLVQGATIQPFTGLSQTFTRVDDDAASITINLNGYSPIQVPLDARSKASKIIPVGTIVASSLTYAELCSSINEQTTFNVNNTWAPADGRGVQGSVYGDINNNVPDLRGLFIRGLNSFYPENSGAGTPRTEQLDQNSSRTPGDIQYDNTRLPRSPLTGSISQAGEHTHVYKEYAQSGGRNGAHWEGVNDEIAPDKNTSSAGQHSHSISFSGGDSETRPKNSAVYYYIKIN